MNRRSEKGGNGATERAQGKSSEMEEEAEKRRDVKAAGGGGHVPRPGGALNPTQGFWKAVHHVGMWDTLQNCLGLMDASLSK